MTSPEFTRFVFVDFENVQKVDLSLLAGRPQVHVMLLIGKNQKKMDTSLSVQMHKYGGQVTPREVGASGHNALDITLACYLGQEIQRQPGAEFFVVSKDKDYDPLIAHLKQTIRISRHDAFASLPFLAPPRKSARSKPPFAVIKLIEEAKAVPATAPFPKNPVADKYVKLVEQFRKGRNRPGTREKLMHHINTVYGQKTAEKQQAEVIDRLVDDGVVAIDGQGKVTYRGSA